MSDKLRMTITYDEQDEEGWIVVRVLGVHGAISQGRTREESRANVIHALRVILALDKDDVNIDRGELLELTLTD